MPEGLAEAAKPEQEREFGADHPNNKGLPEDLRGALYEMAKKFAARELYARRWEVRSARKARFFYRGMQHLVWSADDNSFQVGATGGGGGNSASAEEPSFRQAFNIYLGYAKSFMASFRQQAPNVRFEPEDPESSTDIRAGQEANKMRRVIEKFNDPRALQVDIARLLWTDGRVLAYTRYVADETRFGKDAEGRPKGREVIDVFGVLEAKVPLTAREQHQWPYCQISGEYDVTTMRATFPWAAAAIIAGVHGSAEEEYARNARVATAEGTQVLSQGGDSLAHLVTLDRFWFRPAAFEACEQDVRDRLLELFPDGCHCGFAGATYLFSRNENLDDHIAVLHALPGDGQNRPALGSSEISVQQEFNDAMNLASETFHYVVPATWLDDSVDPDAIQEQKAQPGNHYPIPRKPGEPLENSFYTEQPAQFPPEFAQWLEMLQGPLSQFLTGQQPSLFGGSMEDQKTARGYAMARDQALGLLGLSWGPFTLFWSQVMLQAVRCAAKNRVPGRVTYQVGRSEDEKVVVDVADLDGNLLCYPETDENFPESWTQKSNKFMQLLQGAQSNPELAQLLLHPDNLALAKNMIGLEDLVVPGADSRDKQLAEISELLKESPVPSDPKNPLSPATSSVAIDQIFDDHGAEAMEVRRWINSPDGQREKTENPMGFENVRLHGLAHLQAQQQQAAANQQKPAPKPPAESINFKDLPPEGQAQLAAQAGISLTPQPAPAPPQ